MRDYSDENILAKRRITVAATNNANRRNLTFKNNALFKLSIYKFHNTFIDILADLNIVIPMYNLLKYSDNYTI